jgi:hypothetical protein
MKAVRMIVLALLITGMVLPPAAFAKRGMKWQGSGGWTPAKGMGRGIHLLLKTDKETISVHLGPSWFIESQDVKILKGDRIDVRGSRITFDQKPAIIAAEVTKGNEILKLRDDSGFPVWSGWRRR